MENPLTVFLHVWDRERILLLHQRSKQAQNGIVKLPSQRDILLLILRYFAAFFQRIQKVFFHLRYDLIFIMKRAAFKVKIQAAVIKIHGPDRRDAVVAYHAFGMNESRRILKNSYTVV